MKNWRTTLGGAVAGLGLAVSSIFPEYYKIGLLIAAVGTAINGFFGRDGNVTSNDLGLVDKPETVHRMEESQMGETQVINKPK